jgi:hypothetical protein
MKKLILIALFVLLPAWGFCGEAPGLYVPGDTTIVGDTTITGTIAVTSGASLGGPLTEIDSTDGDDTYTMLAGDIGGTITNQGDDDVLLINLLDSDQLYSAGAYSKCIMIIDVEGLVITVNPEDDDTILRFTNSAGDSIDSPGDAGDWVKLCAVGANEWVMTAVGNWVDGD